MNSNLLKPCDALKWGFCVFNRTLMKGRLCGQYFQCWRVKMYCCLILNNLDFTWKECFLRIYRPKPPLPMKWRLHRYTVVSKYQQRIRSLRKRVISPFNTLCQMTCATWFFSFRMPTSGFCYKFDASATQIVIIYDSKGFNSLIVLDIGTLPLICFLHLLSKSVQLKRYGLY